jgi:choice-of-anchor B domain-containing protein
MRKITLFLLPLSVWLNGAQAQSVPMQLEFHWKDTSLPGSAVFNNTYNEVFGYYADGKEYAIIGSTFGTHIFEVTPGMTPYLVDEIAGAAQGPVVIHRDYKTYQHYLYAVCDEGISSLQVIDLQYLPDSVHVVYDSNVLVERAHNIFIDTATGYLYSCSSAQPSPYVFSPMRVLSLADPENPTFVYDWGIGLVSHVHDAYIHRDTAILNCGGDGLFVVNFQNKTSPVTINTLSLYPDKGYNHSGWISANADYYVMCDENWGYTMKLIDIADFQNIAVTDTFLTHGNNYSIAHNALIAGERIYVSHYHEGMRVFNFSNPNQVFEEAHYDTSPLNAANFTYQGCWGIYPFLPSGQILGSDMQEGLFVTTYNQASLAENNRPTLKVYPNPLRGNLLQWDLTWTDAMVATVYAYDGRVIVRQAIPAGQQSMSLPENLPAGLYVLQLNAGSNGLFSSQFVK